MVGPDLTARSDHILAPRATGLYDSQFPIGDSYIEHMTIIKDTRYYAKDNNEAVLPPNFCPFNEFRCPWKLCYIM